MLGAGNARRDVVVDEVGHAVCVDQPVAGGEIKSRLPLLLGHAVADNSKVGGIIHGSVSSGRLSWQSEHVSR